MPALSVRGVTKRFGDRVVLDDVSLGVRSGRLTLLSGRSGSGKSTLMSIVAGLQAPSDGEVRLGEQVLTELTAEERGRVRLTSMGIVFQDFQLFPDLTVRENVELPMRLLRRPRNEGRKRATELLKRLGMGERAEDFPETLSGGEQQRAAIARALANDPVILLADEPTANLDEANANNVLRLLKGLAAEDRTVLLASHDPVAVRYADERYEIAGGRLYAQPVGPRHPWAEASAGPAAPS